MKDWKAVARASGLGIPAQEIERIAGPLDVLEEAFRPLKDGLKPELEPSYEFRVEEENE